MGAVVRRAVAGAGKTSWLVERYVELVVDAAEPMSPNSVAVITFTDAAARELVDRVRRELTMIATDGSGPRATRARDVVDALGGAPIGTIHSFARRILMQHSVSARLAFGIEVADDLADAVEAAMAARIRSRIEGFSTTHNIASRLTHRKGSFGNTKYLSSDSKNLLRQVSGAVLRAPDWAGKTRADVEPIERDTWEQFARRAVPPPAVLTQGAARAILEALASDMRDAIDSLSEKLAADFQKRVDIAPGLAAGLNDGAEDDPVVTALKAGRLSWLTQPMVKACDAGGFASITTAVDTLTAHNEAVVAWNATLRESYARAAGVQAVEAYLWGRATGGDSWLLQDELLQRCLQLVTTDAPAADALRARYPAILLDEAQDVDATQMELLLLIAAEAGLTVVGDPQQSIYGFRGADHASFNKLQRRLLGDGEPEHAATTYRSLPVIVRAVNAVFAGDPQHTDMTAARGDDGGTVTFLRQTPLGPDDEAVRKGGDFEVTRSDALGDCVVDLLAGGYVTVQDQRTGQWRAPRASDIAILVRTRTPVAAIESALKARNVGVSVRTSRSLIRQPLAEGLVAAVLAIARPDDTRSLLLALRSPVFACTDEALTRFVMETGAMRLWSDGGDCQVGQALKVMREARERFIRHGPAAAVTHLVNATELLAVTATIDDGSIAWREIGLLVDLLAVRQNTTVETDEAFAAWLSDEVATASRSNSSVLDEPESTGVAVTTIHQAKGLQWPIVIVATVTSDQGSGNSLTLLDGDVEVQLNRDYRYVPSEDAGQAPPEDARLMYVAMTRARDHLIVCGVNMASRNAPTVTEAAHIGAALSALGDPAINIVDVEVNPNHVHNPIPAQVPHTVPGLPGPGEVGIRLAAVAASGARTLRRATPSAAEHHTGSGHATGPDAAGTASEPPVDLDASVRTVTGIDAPVSARSIGDCVHAVLEQVDLAAFTAGTDTSCWEELLTAMSGVHQLSAADTEAARTLLGHAQSSEVLRRGGQGVVLRRELPVSGSATDGEELVVTQGIIDLMFAEQNGEDVKWVLVDYKTDSTLRSRKEFISLYEGQLAAYELLLNGCGIEVSEKWLIRLTPTGVQDVAVTDE